MARTETEVIEGPAGGAPRREGDMKGGPRARALLIGALGAAATAFLVTWAEMVLQTIKIGYLQFPPAALGLMLLVVAVSRGVARLARRWDLTSSDLLVIYCMCLVGAMTASHGLVEKMVPALVYPHDAADNTNGFLLRNVGDPDLCLNLSGSDGRTVLAWACTPDVAPNELWSIDLDPSARSYRVQNGGSSAGLLAATATAVGSGAVVQSGADASLSRWEFAEVK